MKYKNATISACSTSAINENVFTSCLMSKVKRVVSVTASKYVHFTPQDREDMEQDILRKLWVARSTYNPAYGSIEAWAGRSARNYVLDMHNKWMHNGCHETSLSYTSAGFDEGDHDEEGVLRFYSRKGGFSHLAREADDDDAHQRQLVSSAFRAAIAKLSPQDRQVLEMAMYDYNGEEMAEELGCTANAVYVRIHKAKKRFAAIYQKMVNDDFVELNDVETFYIEEFIYGSAATN